MKRALIFASAALALAFGGVARAATVYTYRGEAVFGHGFAPLGPFEAIFRLDTPAPSFTLTISGQSIGWDATHLPIEIKQPSPGVITMPLHGHTAPSGAHGYTYLEARFATTPHIQSMFSIEAGAAENSSFHFGYRFDVDSLTVTTEPDLPVGYVDVAALPVLPATNYLPEPSSWALMLLGFGGAGAALRRRRTQVA